MRSEEWMAEFAHLIPDETKTLVLDGSIEICPICNELSAYAWQDADAYEEFIDGIIPGGFKPAPGTVAHIGTASGYEWECGHCKRRLMDADAPGVYPRR